ncbi:MAG: universal stress protein [Phycisphaerae bacterium]|nr:universal stress protein [Phycisphaerae bacterium]
MNILLAYDGSDHADAAIRDLLLAGLPSSARVLVLSVADAWLPEPAQSGGKADAVLPGLNEIRAAVARQVGAQRELAEAGAARLRALFPGWTVTADACADSPAGAIIRRAEGEGGGVDGSGGRADLTVLGSRGRGAIRRALLGSVAQKVMHGLRGSLRIARGHAASGADAAIDPGRPPRIVVGVDGSPDSDAMVEAVAARYWPVGTRVLVACYAQGVAGLEHSGAATISGFGGGGVWSGDVAGAGGPLDSWAARTAERAATRIRACRPGVSVSTIVRSADPTYALVDEAANWGGHAGATAGQAGQGIGADCIFVGARGVRGLERLLLGSVSSAVAMSAPCSVEIVHRRL